VLESPARMYFPEAFRALRAGYIQGSGARDCRIISQKRNSPSRVGRGGVALGSVGSFWIAVL
jgi:hypothetical protein